MCAWRFRAYHKQVLVVVNHQFHDIDGIAVLRELESIRMTDKHVEADTRLVETERTQRVSRHGQSKIQKMTLHFSEG
jgi:hypothetical protein